MLAKTHGEASATTTIEYQSWEAMINRCVVGSEHYDKYYRERGIAVCDRWRQFENFLADMGRKPSRGHSLDRIDNDGNYEPGNCRWATKKEQMRNTRQNHLLTHNGETRCISEWAEVLGVSRDRIWGRIRRGWPPEVALGTP